MNVADSLTLFLQSQAVSQPSQSSGGRGESGGKSDFQTLLEQKGQTTQTGKQEQTTDGQGDTVPAEDSVQEGDPKLNLYYQQMLAAQAIPMAVLLPELCSTPNPIQTAAETLVAIQPEGTEIPVQTAQWTATAPQGEQVSVQNQPLFAAQAEAPAQKAQDASQLKTATPTVVPGEQVIETNTTAQMQADTDDGGTALSSGQEDGEAQLFAAAEREIPLFRTVEATPVKVGEAPVLDGNAQDLDAQLAAKVDEALDAGSQRVEIKLTPKSLGEVTVEITRSEDGAIQVSLSATTQKGTELLEKNAHGLERLLAGGNQSAVQVEVQRPQESRQPQYQQPYDQQEQGGQNQQNQQQPRQQRQRSEEFLQRLRLGLEPLDSTAS